MMVFGFALFVFGYALFYWGWHHMSGQRRYSLWYLLGFGSLFGPSLPAGKPFQFGSGSSGSAAPSTSSTTSSPPATPSTTAGLSPTPATPATPITRSGPTVGV